MPEEGFRQANIEKILTWLIEDGALTGAVVASDDGLLIATAGRADAAIVAAVAAIMKTLAKRAHHEMTEIVTRDDRGNKIVSRYFVVDKEPMLLSVNVPAGRTYRRLTNQAIRRLKNVWRP